MLSGFAVISKVPCIFTFDEEEEGRWKYYLDGRGVGSEEATLQRSNMGPIPQLLLYALLLLALVATPSLGKESFKQPGEPRFLRTQPSPPRPVSAPHIHYKHPPYSPGRLPPPPSPPPPPHHHHPAPSPKNCYLPYPPPPPKFSSPSSPHRSRGRPRPTPLTPVSSPHIFHSPPPPGHPPPPPPIPTPPPYAR